MQFPVRLATILISTFCQIGYSTSAQEETYNIDRSHSVVGFSIKIAGGFSEVEGAFNDFKVSSTVEAETYRLKNVNVEIQATSINTGNERRDNHLRTDDFFDVENYPTVTFISTNIVQNDVDYEIEGDFTMHGITNRITIPFKRTHEEKMVWIFGNPNIIYEGAFTVDRTDYDIKATTRWNSIVAAYNKEVAEWRSSVSMEKFSQFKKMYNEAGVSIYAFKPSTFGENNTDAEIDYGFRAAKSLGASHATVELPENDAQSLRLGEIAAKNKIYIAYHGHEQETPTVWDAALKQSDYNAINLDLGHYVAAGNPSPLDFIKAKHDRIMSMHVKDRRTPENGKGNLPWGEGDTPITEVLQLMRDEKYKFPATIEVEYKIPEGSNAVEEVAKCLDYCSKALVS